MRTLKEWRDCGYPGIFRARSFATWVEWGTKTTPIATQADDGVQINFPSIASAAKFYGFASANEATGEQTEPDADWYRARRKAKDAAEAAPKWTGLMVGFFLRPSEAQRLVIPGGESMMDLHMTLAFLGNSDDVMQVTGDKDFKYLRSVLAEYASERMEMPATVSGIGRFTSVPQGAQTPVYASVDCPELPFFRQSLVSRLMMGGYTPDMTHGFTPHVTLAYIPADAPMPLETVQPVDLRFDTLTLAVGGKRYAFPLIASVSAEVV